jgi:phosphosulfolactate synthase (CoM biosynthesis protein A)
MSHRIKREIGYEEAKCSGKVVSLGNTDRAQLISRRIVQGLSLTDEVGGHEVRRGANGQR